MVPHDILTPEQGAKLQALREAYQDATSRAAAALVGSGMSSDAFLSADAEAGQIVNQIKELLGTSGNHWMS